MIDLSLLLKSSFKWESKLAEEKLTTRSGEIKAVCDYSCLEWK